LRFRPGGLEAAPFFGPKTGRSDERGSHLARSLAAVSKRELSCGGRDGSREAMNAPAADSFNSSASLGG